MPESPTVSPRRLAGLWSVGGLTLVSRVLGLARDVGMAAAFGGGPVLDAFTVAFRLPNLTRRLFGEGAFTAAFLPVFMRENKAGGPEAGWRVATAVFVALAVGLTGLTAVAEAALWTAWRLSGAESTRLLLSLTATLFPYQIALCLAAQAAAVLNAHDRFALPAALSSVGNVVWLGVLAAVAPRWEAEAAAHAVAVGIVASGGLQLALVVPALRGVGFRFRWDWSAARPRLREILTTMLPILIGLGVTELNSLADGLFAWLLTAKEGLPTAWRPLPNGTAAALYLGQRLYQFPLGVFGAALGTVLFPRLARHAAAGRTDELRADLTLGLTLAVAVGLPASAGLIVLAGPLCDAFFRHGAFDTVAAQQTAAAVAAYAAGVWAYIALLIAHRGCYAVGDTTTPLRFAIVAALVNLLSNGLLVWPFGGPGLAIGTAFAAAVQVALLLWTLDRRGGGPAWRPLFTAALRAAGATAATVGVCLLLRDGVAYPPGAAGRMTALAVPVVGGAAVYAAAAWLLGLRELAAILPRRRGR